MLSQMDYAEFCTKVKEGVLNNKDWNISESGYHFYPKNFTTTDMIQLSVIRDTNIKYFSVESDVLMEDFIIIDIPGTTTFTRFSVRNLYQDFQKDGWDTIWKTIDDNIKLTLKIKANKVFTKLDDYDHVKDLLIIRPINYTDNRYELKDAIYKQIGDIALVLYVILYDNDEGLGSSKIQRKTFDIWNKPLDEVWDAAMINTYQMALPRLYINPLDAVNPPYECGAFMALNSSIQHLGVLQVPLITTTKQINGAIAMFYPGVMEKLAELYGDSYYIAFIGINDVRIHCEGTILPHKVLEILKDINKNFPNELLSRKVYRYNKETRELETLEL